MSFWDNVSQNPVSEAIAKPLRKAGVGTPFLPGSHDPGSAFAKATEGGGWQHPVDMYHSILNTAKGNNLGPASSGNGSSPAAAAIPGGFDPSNPFGGGFSDFAKYLANQRQNDLQKGMDFGGGYFGQGNPQIAEIEKAQQQRALTGFSPDERRAYEQNASSGINQQMSTGLRQLHGQLAGRGVYGGAAAGAAIPILSQANQERGKVENQLNAADYGARQKALEDYKNTVTGEREGLLGTGFGFAGLGASDRANALQYGLGQNYINALKAGAGGAQMPSPPQDKGWFSF